MRRKRVDIQATSVPPLFSVDKALVALLRLGETGCGGLSLGQLAKQLGLNKASLHRTLWALRYRGFVEQDDNGNYRLGGNVLRLAESYLRDGGLRDVIHDGLQELCMTINETCHLAVLSGEDIVYIDKVQPERPMSIWSVIGFRNPAVTTALGRAIMSQKFLDYKSFAASFPSPIYRRTTHTRIHLEEVWQEVLDARDRGFPKEEEEYVLGTTCISVAVLQGKDAIAAISITAPSHRMRPDRLPQLTRNIRECIEPHLPANCALQKRVRRVASSIADKAGKSRAELARPKKVAQACKRTLTEL